MKNKKYYFKFIITAKKREKNKINVIKIQKKITEI